MCLSSESPIPHVPQALNGRPKEREMGGVVSDLRGPQPKKAALAAQRIQVSQSGREMGGASCFSTHSSYLENAVPGPPYSVCGALIGGEELAQADEIFVWYQWPGPFVPTPGGRAQLDPGRASATCLPPGINLGPDTQPQPQTQPQSQYQPQTDPTLDSFGTSTTGE